MVSMNRILSAWLPNRHVTWVDVFFGVSAGIWVLVGFWRLSLLWLWVTVGFSAFLLAAGPAGNSALGRSLGKWFRSLGIVGRAIVIGLVVSAVWAVETLFDIPDTHLTSFVIGMMGGIALVVCVSLLVGGRPEGWGFS
jgi:nitrate reductase gamma subunit